MERYHQILENKIYRSKLDRLTELEKDRIFCKHTLEHFCDVARIMYILSLEEGCDLDQDLIYATALFHDIGRIEEYEQHIPHHKASADVARELLPSFGYTEEEVDCIVDVIGKHRKECEKKDNQLADYLYRADKLSRNCFACKAWAQCKWSNEKKNHTLIL